MKMLVVLPCKCAHCGIDISASTVRYEDEWLNSGCIQKICKCAACDAEIVSEVVPEIEAKLRDLKTSEERDAMLESLWKEFEDVPMDPETELIEESFLFFDENTPREDIWHWFDQKHSKGVSYLLYGVPAVKEKVYRVMVTNYGHANIHASSKKEALKQVNQMSASDFDWDNGWSSEDAEIVEEFDCENK